MVSFIDRFNKLGQVSKIAVCVVLSGAVTFVEFLTGSELVVGAFYLLPISLMAWTVSSNAAFALSVLNILIWNLGDLATGHVYSSSRLAFGNGIARTAYLFVGAYFAGQIKESMHAYSVQAREDMLTSLPNRRAFMEALERECVRSARIASTSTVAYIDLDNFKFVNDRFGHHVGDQVLKVVGQTLKTRIRKTDIAARFGGDEFVVLLSMTDREGAEIILEDLRERLLKAMKVHHWPVTFSIGSLTSTSTYSASELMQRADRLMYAVKKRTKDDIDYALTTGENFAQGTQTI